MAGSAADKRAASLHSAIVGKELAGEGYPTGTRRYYEQLDPQSMFCSLDT